MTYQSPKRDTAASELVYYLKQAGGDNNELLDSDVKDIREIVDNIVEAAKEEIRHEMQPTA